MFKFMNADSSRELYGRIIKFVSNGWAYLRTSNDDIGSITDTPAASDSADGTVVSFLKRIAANITSLSTLLSTTNITVGGFTKTVQCTELTRPSDTNAYAALDAISNSTSAPTLITIPSISRIASGTGYITKVRCITDLKTCVARLRLHIFNVSTITPVNDNTAYPLLYANRITRIGSIDLPAFATEDPSGSTGAESLNTTIRLPFTADASSNIYMLVETLDAFTPGNPQKFTFEFTAENN